MEFRTQVTIDKPSFLIEPCEEILFVGSCFADAIGQRFREEAFPVIANPFGVMYNPASILHTLQRLATTTPAASSTGPRVAFLTLGTNHIYRLKETGEIVDNCEKRPQVLFQEEELTVDQCANYLTVQTFISFLLLAPSAIVNMAIMRASSRRPLSSSPFSRFFPLFLLFLWRAPCPISQLMKS